MDDEYLGPVSSGSGYCPTHSSSDPGADIWNLLGSVQIINPDRIDPDEVLRKGAVCCSLPIGLGKKELIVGWRLSGCGKRYVNFVPAKKGFKLLPKLIEWRDYWSDKITEG